MEQTSKTLKVLLGILLVLLIATAAFVLLRQRGIQKASTIAPSLPAVSQETPVETPSATPPSQQTPTLPAEEAQKQIQAIQAKADAGTITLEEANNQMIEINAKTIQAVPATSATPPVDSTINVQN